MIFLTDIEIKHFKNIEHTNLKDLSHINIFIGPNNCGKSNLLRAINKLALITDSPDVIPSCKTCNYIVNESNWFFNYVCAKDTRDVYENKSEPEIIFSFNEIYLKSREQYQNSVHELSGRSRALYDKLIQIKGIKLEKGHFASIANFLQHIEDWGNRISLQGIKGPAKFRSLHGSLIDQTLVNEIKNEILECPEKRLESYKGQKIVDYVKAKDLNDTELRRVQDNVRAIVDSKLAGYKTTSLNYMRGSNRFLTPIPEQGSGVRSVVCLMSDVISEGDRKIILIDEPELGLNPAAKREFIDFLKEETKEKQVFIATHDPMFVNPKLWADGKVSIYLFSIVKNEFVKIDLNKNAEDPNTFAGYLPHTMSLCDFHLYVEGKYDVYIHQIFLRKFLEDNRTKLKSMKASFSETLNRIGIYHLAGDFWSHLLHTLPKKPYRALLLFDGDKRGDVQQAIERFEQNRLENLPNFFFTKGIKFTQSAHADAIPVHCLSKDKIEHYLQPIPQSKSQGPEIAMQMVATNEKIPHEFGMIYNEILRVIYPKVWK